MSDTDTLAIQIGATVSIPSVPEIPTLDEWGLLLLASALAFAADWRLRGGSRPA